MEERLVLVHLTCSPALGQMRACRVPTSVASQQGHLTATCSSISMKRFQCPRILLRI